MYTLFHPADTGTAKNPNVQSPESVTAAIVDQELATIGYDSPYNAALMLVYASTCYFASSSDHKIAPIWFTAASFRGLYFQSLMLPVYVEWGEGSRRFPKRVFFVDDGFDREVDNGNTLFFAKPSERKYEGALAAGFTNCSLEVHTYTNLAHYAVPMSATINRLAPIWSEASVLKLRTVERFVVEAHEFTRLDDGSVSVPEIRGPTRAVDFRFAKEDPKVPRLAYEISNRWLSKQEVKNSEPYRIALTSWDNNRRAFKNQGDSGAGAARTNLRYYLLIAFAAVTFGSAIFAFASLKKEKK